MYFLPCPSSTSKRPFCRGIRERVQMSPWCSSTCKQRFLEHEDTKYVTVCLSHLDGVGFSHRMIPQLTYIDAHWQVKHITQSQGLFQKSLERQLSQQCLSFQSIKVLQASYNVFSFGRSPQRYLIHNGKSDNRRYVTARDVKCVLFSNFKAIINKEHGIAAVQYGLHGSESESARNLGH